MACRPFALGEADAGLLGLATFIGICSHVGLSGGSSLCIVTRILSEARTGERFTDCLAGIRSR